MRNIVAIRAKANAHYICQEQECGSTELIQSHHEIPGDDDSLIVLCAECHSRRHPDVPKALFFNKGIQPYWHNKSASSLAKELGVHPRTIIRAAKRLEILPGELSPWDEELIRNNVPKVQWKQKAKRARSPKMEMKILTDDLITVPKAAKALGRPKMTLYCWIDAGKLVSIKLGGILFIPKSEVERLLNAKE